MSLRADRDPGGANFYIFVPSLVLPKTTARVGSISSIAEKKLSYVHGVRSLMVYSMMKTHMMILVVELLAEGRDLLGGVIQNF